MMAHGTHAFVGLAPLHRAPLLSRRRARADAPSPGSGRSWSISSLLQDPATEWRFDAGGDLGWKAGAGVTGLELPEAAQGQSLVPLLTGDRERFRSRPAFSERFRQDEDRPSASSFAVVAEGFKLIHNVDLPKDQPDYPEWELFDHQKDPLNLVNVADEHPEVVERLSRLLKDWYKFAQAAKLPSDDESSRP